MLAYKIDAVAQLMTTLPMVTPPPCKIYPIVEHHLLTNHAISILFGFRM